MTFFFVFSNHRLRSCGLVTVRRCMLLRYRCTHATVLLDPPSLTELYNSKFSPTRTERATSGKIGSSQFSHITLTLTLTLTLTEYQVDVVWCIAVARWSRSTKLTYIRPSCPVSIWMGDRVRVQLRDLYLGRQSACIQVNSTWSSLRG